MPVYFFVWTPDIVAHLAEHDVSPEDFEEVVANPDYEDISRSTGNPVAFGSMSKGRYLCDECSGVVVEPKGAWAMNFVADESGRFVDEVDPIAETVFEVDLVPPGNWNPICDDDHRTALQKGLLAMTCTSDERADSPSGQDLPCPVAGSGDEPTRRSYLLGAVVRHFAACNSGGTG